MSALLNGKNPLILKNLPLYNSDTFSYTFWVYLHDFQMDKAYCPIIWKGQEDLAANKFARTPAIFVNGVNGKIKVFLTVENTSGKSVSEPTAGLTAETLGSLQQNKWTFIAVTVSKTNIRIYMNGVLDAIQSLENYKLKVNTSDIFIGGIPQITSSYSSLAKANEKNLIDEYNLLGNCSIHYNIDALKIFNVDLKLFQIQSFVKDSLGLIEPSYFHLACSECTYADATLKCLDGFHLCSSLEYYSGVMQAMKVMGWLSMDYNIFASDSVVSNPAIKGLAVCCRNQ